MATPLARLFSEITQGAPMNGAFILNSGDAGMLRAVDSLSSADASQCTNGGATIAAHVLHVRYGLSLMNRWASRGGNPFADAKWDEAWKTSVVSDGEWAEIRAGFRAEVEQWLKALDRPAPTDEVAYCGLVASIAHTAYHLGAIRQISKSIRGPKEGNYS